MKTTKASNGIMEKPLIRNESISDDEDKDEDDELIEDSGWRQRCLRFIRGMLMNGGGGRRALALVALTFGSYFLYRKYRRSLLWSRIKTVLWNAWRGQDYQRAKEAPLSLLWEALRNDGVVLRALVGSSIVVFKTKEGGWRKSTLPPNSPSVQENLIQSLTHSGSDVSALPEPLLSKLATPILAALPFVYLALLYRMMRNLHGNEDIAPKMYKTSRKHRTTFADVAGIDHVVAEVSEVVSFLENPKIYQGVGARPPRGILLYGPPGSGKTLLARAVAGEARCDTFIACSGSDFVELYVGRGAARVRSLFQQARQEARRRAGESWWRQTLMLQPKKYHHLSSNSRPVSAILFIDEFDALAKTRCQGIFSTNDEREQTLNQLLTAMDGFNTANEEEDVTVIVIAASNRADVLDPAVLRRFDRQIFVGYPDAEGRKAILLVHARRIQCGGEIDWEQLASEDMTPNFSGADLRNLINEAALLAVRDRCKVVEQRHLVHAAKRLKAMKDLPRPQTQSIFSQLS